MTAETRAELEQKLAEKGLTVIMTRDYDGILVQLARLAQFERLMITALENDPLELLDVVMAEVRAEQEAPPNMPDDRTLRPLEIMDLPIILTAAHNHLHDQLGKQALHDPLTVHAAVSAFVGILCRR